MKDKIDFYWVNGDRLWKQISTKKGAEEAAISDGEADYAVQVIKVTDNKTLVDNMKDFVFTPNFDHNIDYNIQQGVVVINWWNDFHQGSVEAPDLETALKFLVQAVTEQTIWNKDAIYEQFKTREDELRSVRGGV